MTAAAVLAELQAAWNAAPTLPPRPAIVPLIVSPTGDIPSAPLASPMVASKPKGLALCPLHTNRADWHDEPDDARQGWIRTTCRACGAFIGYRPTNTTKGNKR